MNPEQPFRMKGFALFLAIGLIGLFGDIASVDAQQPPIDISKLPPQFFQPMPKIPPEVLNPPQPPLLQILRWFTPPRIGFWILFALFSALGSAHSFRAINRSPAQTRPTFFCIATLGGIGVLFVCAGLGLYFFAMQDDSNILLPFGSVGLVLVGLLFLYFTIVKVSVSDDSHNGMTREFYHSNKR
jgi:hypothetical protein